MRAHVINGYLHHMVYSNGMQTWPSVKSFVFNKFCKIIWVMGARTQIWTIFHHEFGVIVLTNYISSTYFLEWK